MLRYSASPYHGVRFRPAALPDARFHPLLYLRNLRNRTLTVKPTVAFIGLGSNLSHPRRQLARATAALAHLPHSRLIAVSPNYLSAPVGTSDPQPDYVNAVAAVRTALAPRALLRRLQAIERCQHRHRELNAPRNAPRTLDLDLLLYGSRRI